MENNINCASEILLEKKLTIAFAESATAGLAAAKFSLACNAGKFLKGGLVCYDADLKSAVLKVPRELIDKCTPESMEVTEAIARGLARLIDADIHIGVTGLPCPGGSETEDKPVGTMFIYATLNEKKLFADRHLFDGTHKEIVEKTVDRIAMLLQQYL